VVDNREGDDANCVKNTPSQHGSEYQTDPPIISHEQFPRQCNHSAGPRQHKDEVWQDGIRANREILLEAGNPVVWNLPIRSLKDIPGE
jgi:hypothetical protein